MFQIWLCCWIFCSVCQ